ncbi:MAG: dicarboxylate/amino acid:cation symporter, partial [Chlamydiia bacterium]|nr:dicarboxylate/amino acid:cation symporter [Chlamydiia bacterium]
LLKMMVIPLVVTSLFVGITNISNPVEMGPMGLRIATYFLFSSACAIGVGLLAVNLIQPGVGADLEIVEQAVPQISGETSFWKIVSHVIPANPVEALAKTDMLGIIFFTMIFAYFTLRTGGEDRDRIVRVAKSLHRITMRMVNAIITLAPYGIFCLITNLIITTGFSAFVPLSWYLLTVTIALTAHFFLLLPSLVFLLTRSNPYKLMRAMSPALTTAFSTASSAATLPLTIECATEVAKMDNRVASIALPIGATLNMDGTALYEGVTVLFIAQVLGIDLSLWQQFVVFATALIVSIGAAGIPHAGLIMMVIVLEAVGLPLQATALIWGIDRFVDMMRTAVNVWSDIVGTRIVDHFEKPIFAAANSHSKMDIEK